MIKVSQEKNFSSGRKSEKVLFSMFSSLKITTKNFETNGVFKLVRIGKSYDYWAEVKSCSFPFNEKTEDCNAIYVLLPMDEMNFFFSNSKTNHDITTKSRLQRFFFNDWSNTMSSHEPMHVKNVRNRLNIQILTIGYISYAIKKVRFS